MRNSETRFTMKLTLLSDPIRRWLAAFLFAVVVPAQAEGLHLDSTGMRGGFSASSLNAQFFQAEAFVNWGLPWNWSFAHAWHLESHLDLSAGWLRGRADEGFVGSVGPSLKFGRDGLPLFLDVGVSPTWLSRDEFGATNFGVPFQFTSHVGFLLELGSHGLVGY